MTSIHCSARPGRALVELLVASLVLTVAAAGCLSLFQATATFSDRVVQFAAARDLTRDLAEQVQAVPCTVTAGAETRSRLTGAWTVAAAGQAVVVDLAVTLPAVPASGSSRALHTLVAGWCP